MVNKFDKNICANCGSNKILADNSRNARNAIIVNRSVVTGNPLVCCDCGFVSTWVNSDKEMEILRKEWAKNVK